MGRQLSYMTLLLLFSAAASAQSLSVSPYSTAGSAEGRSDLSITEFIASKLPELLRIYAARLAEKPGVGGTIHFNFAIDESGNVPFCAVVNSAIGDDTLENRLADFIMSWKFDTAGTPGNVVMVTCPFDFSREKRPGGEALTVGTDTIGGRSKESILRTVKKRSSVFRELYRARLADKPGLEGAVCFRFVINESGKVVSCRVDSSTVNDRTLENRLAEEIRGWTFEKTDIPGDIAAVTYPFVFSAGVKRGTGVLLIAAALIVSLCSLVIALTG
jgi:TonB family protein